METDNAPAKYTDRTGSVMNVLRSPSSALTARLSARRASACLLSDAAAYLSEHPDVRVMADGYGQNARWWWGAPAQVGAIPEDVHLAVTLALAVNDNMRNLIDPVDWTA